MRYTTALIAFVLCTCVALVAKQAPSAGAKDLFYDPGSGITTNLQVPAPEPRTPPLPAPSTAEGTPNPSQSAVARTTPRRTVTPPRGSPAAANPKIRGLHYWVELEEPGGSGYYTTDQQVFRSGQRIRLHFVSNVDGHILLIQRGSSGVSTLLFPAPDQGLVDNRLQAGKDQVLPGTSHWFRFDQRPGTERLIVLFARDATELERFPVKTSMEPQETRALLEAVKSVKGSKDLIVETETHSAAEIGTYGVNLRGEPVVLEISLRHH